MTLRGLEDYFNTSLEVKKHLKSNNETKKKVTKSDISDRLNLMPPEYVIKIHEHVSYIYKEEFDESHPLNPNRFDSTIITLSGKLLKDGLNPWRIFG
jgi:hypothetical protein